MFSNSPRHKPPYGIFQIIPPHIISQTISVDKTYLFKMLFPHKANNYHSKTKAKRRKEFRLTTDKLVPLAL